MLKKSLVIAIIIVMSSISSYAATWVGGSEGSWEEPENWEPWGVPGKPDEEGEVSIVDVTLGIYDPQRPLDLELVRVSMSHSRRIGSLSCGGKVFLTGAGRGVIDLSELTNEEIHQHFNGAGWAELVTTGVTNSAELDISGIDIKGSITNRPGAKCDLSDLTVNGNITNMSGAEIDMANLVINGNVYNHENAVLFAEEMIDFNRDHSAGGSLLQNAGMIFFWEANVDLSSGGSVDNTGEINLHNGAFKATSIINHKDGVIQGFGNFGTDNDTDLVQNDGLISARGGSLYVFTNSKPMINSSTGTLRSESSSSLHIRPMFAVPDQTDVVNLGKIEIKTGSSMTFHCNLVNQTSGFNGGQINLYGGSLAATNITQTAGATFQGMGNIAGNITIDDRAKIRFTGPTNVFGNVFIDNVGTLEISDGTTIVINETRNEGIIHMLGGRLIPQGGITTIVPGRVIWEAGLYNSSSDFNLDGEVNMKDFVGFLDTWLWQSDL